jgi:hypothetical protein
MSRRDVKYKTAIEVGTTDLYQTVVSQMLTSSDDKGVRLIK